MRTTQLMTFLLLCSFVTSLAFADDTVTESTVFEDDTEPSREKPRPRPIPPFKPDLTVTAMTLPQPSGSNYLVHVTVKNIGRAPASNFQVMLWDVYASNGPRKLVNTLAAGQSVTLSFFLSGPENQTNCYISAIADYGNLVTEVNEQNNSKTYYGNW